MLVNTAQRQRWATRRISPSRAFSSRLELTQNYVSSSRLESQICSKTLFFSILHFLTFQRKASGLTVSRFVCVLKNYRCCQITVDIFRQKTLSRYYSLSQPQAPFPRVLVRCEVTQRPSGKNTHFLYKM